MKTLCPKLSLRPSFMGPRVTPNILWALLLLSTTHTLSACAVGYLYPPAYSAEAIDAWVVDAETKKPLADVIVTANWELRGGGLALGGSAPVGQLMVMETVTDKNGRFHFPAWGPIQQMKGWLQDVDPRLIFFKSGHQYQTLTNKFRFDVEAMLEPTRRSDWNGKTIELKPFKGTMEEYARHLSYLDSLIYSIIGPIDSTLRIDCEWKKIPRLIVAVHKQALFFHEEQIRSSLNRIQHLPNDDEKCGPLKEFFKEYLP